MFAVEFDAVWKIYKKDFRTVEALKNLSIKIPKNSIFSIIGPNGAGKTTALKLITAISKPTKGKIKVLGKENFEEKDKEKIGFLPENPSFFSNITPREFLKFVLFTSEKRIEEERVDTILKEVGLFNDRNEKVRKFSKGMVQRLGIAQAIIHNPELIVLDEPFSGLDPIAKEKLKNIILNLFKNGKTIILSSHNLADIESLSTHIMLINQGELKLSGNIRELQKNAEYEIVFYGDIDKLSHENLSKVGDKTILYLKDENEFKKILKRYINSDDIKIVSVNLTLNNYLKRYYQ